MDLEQERLDMLRAAYEGRSRAVMHYQVNIDNFTEAVDRIGQTDDVNLASFVSELTTMIVNERAQQARERVMLEVITAQLEKANVRPA